MALQAVEVEAGTAVADVAVRSDQVLCAVSSAQSCQRGLARVAEVRAERLGAEPVHGDQAAVTLRESGQPLPVPCRRSAAQQQLERWRGKGLMQAAGNLAPKQREVGKAAPGGWAATQPREPSTAARPRG